MTAYQLFRGLTGVDGELLAAAELVDSRKEPAPKKLPARKIWLVAAVIALALLLVGCAVAYALTVFDSPAEMIAGLYGGSDSAAPSKIPTRIGRTPHGLFRGMKSPPWRKPLLRSFKNGFPL